MKKNSPSNTFFTRELVLVKESKLNLSAQKLYSNILKNIAFLVPNHMI